MKETVARAKEAVEEGGSSGEGNVKAVMEAKVELAIGLR